MGGLGFDDEYSKFEVDSFVNGKPIKLLEQSCGWNRPVRQEINANKCVLDSLKSFNGIFW